MTANWRHTAVIRLAILGVAALGLSACSQREPDLINFKNGQDGPDEFSILPTKPLENPPSLAELPPPTPGGTNLVDPNPDFEAIAALGGRPSVLTRSSDDGGLVRYAGRYGVSPSIRGELAAEDLEFRRRNDGRLLERWFNLSVYNNSYERQELNQYDELRRMRNAGVASSSSPPVIPDDDE